MDPQRFDALAKALATRRPRRSVLRGLAGSAVGGLLSLRPGARLKAQGVDCGPPPANQYCASEGRCIHCPDGQGAHQCRCFPLCPTDSTLFDCNGSCVDFNTDEANCGACGRACPPESTCVDGNCFCNDSNSLICSNYCANLQTDPNHCGSCFNRCEGTCVDGQCQALDGTCSTGGTCGNATTRCVSGHDCYCFLTAEATPICAGNYPCESSPFCTSSADCPSGWTCIQGCCNDEQGSIRNTCAPLCTLESPVCPCPNYPTCPVCSVPGADPCAGAPDGTACNEGGNNGECRGGVCCFFAGATCTGDSACCGGTCLNGQCCAGAGAPCNSTSDCCLPGNAVCVAGACCFSAGHSCTDGSICCGGSCASGQCCAAVDAACSSTSDCCDPATCDAQGCRNGNACTAGVCRPAADCPPGQTPCNGACVDTKTDRQNCGNCGKTCKAGQRCVDGKCRGCPRGKTLCNGVCVDTKTDPNNCNECGKKCASGETCVDGGCKSARKVVVFIAGLGSSVDQARIDAWQGPCSDPSSDPDFGPIRAALVSMDFVCGDFLLYSYTGGSVDSGVNRDWHPKTYSCEDTGQKLDRSVSRLYSMLRDYRRAHPEVQFVLVGHSLGGAVALEVTKRVGQDASLPAGSVAAVITLDSPLNHTSRQNRQDIKKVVPLAANISCVVKLLLGSQVAKDLSDVTDANRQAIRAQKEELVAAARARGVRFMTIGNEQDCLWYLTLCGLPRGRLGGDWIDDRPTMLIRNADQWALYSLGTQECDLSVGDPFWELACLGDSHYVPLQTEAVANDIAAFVGRNAP